jgi:hypothetical protein
MSADAGGASSTAIPTQDELIAMLTVIRDAEGGADSVDNGTLCRRLGWSEDVAASRLGVARDRLLIWGVRVGGQPRPRFVDLELTVQGRRFLRDLSPTTSSIAVDRRGS